MTEAEGPVPPELEVTAEELEHVQANVYDHTVLCLPAAYVRAVPGLAPNVSGGYARNSDDPRVSDVKTLWVGRAAELAAAEWKLGMHGSRAKAADAHGIKPMSASTLNHAVKNLQIAADTRDIALQARARRCARSR